MTYVRRLYDLFNLSHNTNQNNKQKTETRSNPGRVLCASETIRDRRTMAEQCQAMNYSNIGSLLAARTQSEVVAA